MDRLQREMDRLFNTSSRGRTQVAPSYPAVNLWGNADGVLLTAELPGVKPEDIDINIVGETLTLSGSRQPDESGENVEYHRRERGYGKFSRTLQMPFQIDANKVDANFKNGVLTLTLPRSEAEKPKKITVKTGELSKES
jgi:HSP20 family protein